jgi:hypothetical protein
LVAVFVAGFVIGQQTLARRIDRETREIDAQIQSVGDTIARIEEFV